MEPLLIECAVRSSLIATFAGLVLLMMRIKAATARHAVWVGVVVAMMALPGLLIWGPKVPLPILPRAGDSAIVLTLPTGDHIAARAVDPPRRSSQPLTQGRKPEWLILLYLVGVLVFLIRLGIGAARMNALLRGRMACSAPVTAGWLRPKLILPSGWQQWPKANLDAVLAHERAHARRRDPLWQLLALLNRALFWFHPLAWWLERTISGLAEEACDLAVLSCGYDARDYSACLLALARSVQQTGTRVGALGVAMPGTGLEHRIRQILSVVPAQRISRPRMVFTAVLCMIAAASFTAGTLVRAQSGSKSHLEFEVASVRPSDPNAGGRGGFKGRGGGVPAALGHGRFNYSDSLLGYIVQAYHVTACRPFPARDTCPLISGGPSWIDKDQFDVRAKTPEATPDYTLFQLAQGQAPEIQLMLQALLADRFNLKLHREKKQMPVYSLELAKKGPKVKKSGAVGTKQIPGGAVVEDRAFLFRPSVQPNGERTIQLTVKNWPIQGVADTFSSMLSRPVLNRTGLKGEIDFTLDYAADGDQPVSELTGPELFTALQEQAGLKLDATKAIVDVFVVDHAERPSEN